MKVAAIILLATALLYVELYTCLRRARCFEFHDYGAMGKAISVPRPNMWAAWIFIPCMKIELWART